MTYSRIVVGTDGSPTAERAVRRAAALARASGTPLVIATGWYRDMPDPPVPSEAAEWPGESTGGVAADWASKTVSDAAAIARSSGVDDVRTATPQGGAADGLIDIVADDPDILLVVGTVGLGSRAERMIGNVPHQITHHAPVDVLLVQTTGTTDAGLYGRVALATDGSETAARAVSRGFALARAIDAEASLVTVARSEEEGASVLDDASTAIGDGSVERIVLVDADVSDALGRTAAEHGLLVIGNKGMSGPSRLLGSVANDITHRVPTDLLLVNTTKRS